MPLARLGPHPAGKPDKNSGSAPEILRGNGSFNSFGTFNHAKALASATIVVVNERCRGALKMYSELVYFYAAHYAHIVAYEDYRRALRARQNCCRSDYVSARRVLSSYPAAHRRHLQVG
jgi:hypothetical protein